MNVGQFTTVDAAADTAAALATTREKLVRQHCPDIDAADEQLMRVTRPGGRIAIFDFERWRWTTRIGTSPRAWMCRERRFHDVQRRESVVHST